MNKFKIIFLWFCVCLFAPMNTFAHPGRTDSNGCHVCKSNCENWGLSYGEYHCHNTGSKNNNNNNKTSINQNNQTVSVKKSNNANLKSLTIDGELIEISENMNFTTTNASPNIIGVAYDKKATVEISKSDILSNNFRNKVIITVTAEDLTKKEYNLFINLVNTDATLKSLKIGNSDIEINDEMNFSTYDSSIELDAISNDKMAKVIFDDIYKLDVGNNKIVIKVLASDGKTSKEYILNVQREETNNIVYIIIGLVFICGISLGCIQISKEIKNKKRY